MQKEYYHEYARLETSHWWFTARLNILTNVITDCLAGKPNNEVAILNAGVATGNTTRMLQKFGPVTSVEYDSDCCDYLRSKTNIEVTQASLTRLPFADNSFDVVCAFDVIEHIENDQQAIGEINRVLKPDGIAVITVPAYNFLWSQHDEINHHWRRYSLSQLKRMVRKKLSIRYISYFNFFLFPPIGLARLVGRLFAGWKGESKAAQSDFASFRGAKLIDRFFYRVFNFERRLVGKIKLPFGVSLIVVSSKHAIQ